MYKKLISLIHLLRFIFSRNKKRIRGKNNKIILNTLRIKNVIFDIKGDGNTIIFGKNATIKQTIITLRGNNHTLEIGQHVSISRSEIKFEDHNCLIKIGNSTRILPHGEISAAEPFSCIDIGSECLFSSHIDIRNTDSHSIIDLATGQRINQGKNIKIGNKVWLGSHVQILKGVVIGESCIIGSRSLVTKSIPAHSVAAGVPARVLRNNVDWCEKRI